MDHALELLGPEIMSLSPKDVMLFAMRVALKSKWIFRAAEIAADVAPYVHPKLSAVTTMSGNEDEQRSDEDIRRELDEIRTREAVATRERTVAEKMSPQPEGVGDSGHVPGRLLPSQTPRPTLQ